MRLSSPGHDVNIHENCRITFRNRIARKEAQTRKLPVSSSETIHESNEPVAAPAYRIRRGSLQKKQICFVCNVETTDDSKPYNSGGLGRCSEKNAVSKVERSKDLKIQDEGDKFHDAAKRLDVILSGASYDVFAVDVYYCKSCYDNFTYAYDISFKLRIPYYLFVIRITHYRCLCHCQPIRMTDSLCFLKPAQTQANFKRISLYPLVLCTKIGCSITILSYWLLRK